jgi:hypothetical protein
MPQQKDDPPPHVLDVTPGDWVKAARLINFPTGQHELRQAHKEWIDRDLRDVLKRLNHPWVDLIGHASRRGDPTKNKALSERRCQSVRARIEKLSSSVEFRFNVDSGTGESEAERYGKAEGDNSGFDRSVDVIVFGVRPIKKPEPLPDPEPVGSKQWRIRLLVGGSIAKIVGGGAFLFEIYSGVIQEASGPTHDAARLLYGQVGLEPDLPLPIPIPQVSKRGPWASFWTTKPVRARAFEGEADLRQDPGAGTYVLPPIPGMPNIPISVGGDMHLTFKSKTLKSRSVGVTPREVTIKSDEGIQLSLGSAGPGVLKIVGKIGTRPV